VIHAFTSSGPDDIGRVKALFESLRKHCPDFHLHWVVADRRGEESVDAIGDLVDDVVFATDLDCGKDPAWVFQHTVFELSAVIKHHAALDILERPDCEMVLYFDPDIVVFSDLDDLVEELSSASVVLTPHVLRPQEDMNAVLDHELWGLREGIFNLGFLGIRNCDEARRFIDWLIDRCREFCWDDRREGALTGQRWVNFAPVFFPTSRILHNPRFNVSSRNINQRELRGSFDQGVTVDGEPLGFFHFAVVERNMDAMMINKYAGSNRIPQMLVDWHMRHTEKLGADAPPKWRLGEYADGVKIEDVHRQAFRARIDLQRAFPDPYLVAENEPSFREWLRVAGPSEIPELLSPDADAHF
jgi:hypothetical protein